MKKKIIHTIDLKDHFRLLGMAMAMAEIGRMVSFGKECEEIPTDELDMLEALENVILRNFWNKVNTDFPKYAENLMRIHGDRCEDTVVIQIFDEKLSDESDDHKCDDHECDESVSLDDMLKGIDGLESADDYVERLADDLRNKKGGQA